MAGGMDGGEAQEPALDPEDLARFFVSRANAGDVEGLVALYEPDAVLAGPEGRIWSGLRRSAASTPSCSPTDPGSSRGNRGPRCAAATWPSPRRA